MYDDNLVRLIDGTYLLKRDLYKGNVLYATKGVYTQDKVDRMYTMLEKEVIKTAWGDNMKLTRILNHMTLRQLHNYAMSHDTIIEINAGTPEEVILDVKPKRWYIWQTELTGLCQSD